MSLSQRWHDYEGPTWLVALAIYGGWLALILSHASLAWWIVVPVGAWLVAWHGSLQHETIDALEHVPAPLRSALAFPPLGIFFPIGTYRREHRLHHLAGTHVAESAWDPESYYHDPVRWARYPRFVRALYRANQTLLGRLTLGVLLQTAAAVRGGVRAMLAGDRVVMGEWALHVASTGALLWWIAVFAHMPVWQYVFFIAYPAASLTMLRSFYEHRLPVEGVRRTATIENRFPFGLLFLNNNYHVMHHATPSLPWYRIPQAWRARRGTRFERGLRFERDSQIDRGSSVEHDYHFRGYGAIAKRWFVRVVFEPVEGRT